MKITTKYIKLPKYLLIFIENGYRFSESDVNNLNNFEVGIEEGYSNISLPIKFNYY